MPRSGVAYEQVVEAAQEVLRDGQSPSVRAVTNILGTGSSTTINKHLRTFWRDLGQSMKAPTLEGMPGDLVKPMRELWDVAKNTALERLAEERTAARAKADQAIERVTEIQQLLETRDKELVAAQDHARALEERITALSESEQALSDRLKAEHDRRARAESDRKAQAERAEIDRGHFQARVDQMAAANERLEERITAQDHSHQARLKEIQERAEAQEEHWLRQLEVVRQEARETLDREVAARHSAEKQTKACQEEIAALR